MRMRPVSGQVRNQLGSSSDVEHFRVQILGLLVKRFESAKPTQSTNLRHLGAPISGYQEEKDFCYCHANHTYGLATNCQGDCRLRGSQTTIGWRIR